MARDETYKIAEQKIEAARESGAKKLDLSGEWEGWSPKLTALPETLRELTTLESLDLSNNRLPTLPDWLSELRQLKSLRLSNNKLTTLPKGLYQLRELRSLELSNNEISALPDWLDQLTELRTLRVFGNQLAMLPSSLGRLVQLQSLNISANQITALPESLAMLTNLQRLEFSGNRLKGLPLSLGRLTRLRYLDCSNNKIAVLPDFLCHLTSLDSLWLDSVGLRTIPEWLGKLKELRAVNLRNNDLTTLPDSIAELTKLQGLYIENNKLITLSEGLRNCQLMEDLRLSSNSLSSLPYWIGELSELQILEVANNQLRELPASIANLRNLHDLYLGLTKTDTGNPIGKVPDCIRALTGLKVLWLQGCQLRLLPNWLNKLTNLESLHLDHNQLTDIPETLGELKRLETLDLDNNPLNPELDAARKEGLEAIKRYLRSKADAQVVLNEAKLILIGEGEVGKSCLLGALRGDDWIEGRVTTHGIEIKPVEVMDPKTQKIITLNGWDFGGQRVYRPTHQLFFSSPAVYLVIWKPREGSQQGFVKEWISLIKHREPDAKILVVATHGGPGARQPDIDRQEIWDLFGRDRVVDFFHVESKPSNHNKKTGNWTGECKGIKQLRDAIASLSASLPEVGRTVPKRWYDVREALRKTGEPYLPLDRVLALCQTNKMDEDESKDFIRVSHRLGHLIHYENDSLLRDVVVLKPDWLATAISFVLDDEDTRKKHGLVKSSRLGKLWTDKSREVEFRYPAAVHPMFVNLMQRFDLSYRVAGSPLGGQADETSLIAQLVPDVRPQADIAREWPSAARAGDEQQVQICRIVDGKGQSATAEGLFYQLIVRLHKLSLGREDFNRSVHWQRGLILDDDYNGRALLEHTGNDVQITVRAAYPGNLLAVLTREVKWLVEDFWEGLRCEVVVPCIDPCGKKAPGTGVFEVQKLIAFKRQGMTMFPCTVSGCDQLQDIGQLLQNAPIAQRPPIELLLTEGFAEMRSRLDELRLQNLVLDQNLRRIMSQVEDAYRGVMLTLTDEAKEGPRLFSLEPVDRSAFNPSGWAKKKFRVTLWCEHTRLPLPLLNNNDNEGVYEFDVTREWFAKAAPFLKVLAGTLSLMLPVAASTTKLVLDEAVYKTLENQLDLGKSCAESMLKVGEKSADWFTEKEGMKSEQMGLIRADGGVLREFQTWLKKEDPGFGDLRRVLNKRQEFLWVHRNYETEY